MCWWLPISICIPDISVKLQTMGQMYLATPPQTRALCSLPKASEWQLPSPAYALGWLAESISIHHTHSFGAVSLKWIQIKRHVLSSTVWAKRPSALHSWLVILFRVCITIFLHLSNPETQLAQTPLEHTRLVCYIEPQSYRFSAFPTVSWAVVWHTLSLASCLYRCKEKIMKDCKVKIFTLKFVKVASLQRVEFPEILKFAFECLHGFLDGCSEHSIMKSQSTSNRCLQMR